MIRSQFPSQIWLTIGVDRVPFARERFPLNFRFTHCTRLIDQPQIGGHSLRCFQFTYVW